MIISLKKYRLDWENKTKDIIFETYVFYTNCKISPLLATFFLARDGEN